MSVTRLLLGLIVLVDADSSPRKLRSDAERWIGRLVRKKEANGGSLLAGCPVWNPGDPSANMPEAIGVEGEGRTGFPRGLCSLVTAKRAASAGGLPWQLYLIPTTMPEYPSPYHHLPPILTLSHTQTCPRSVVGAG